MRFLNPLMWSERISPHFDYYKDVPTKSTTKTTGKDGLCGYEYFKDVPLGDGILVSRTMLENTAKPEREDARWQIRTSWGEVNTDIRGHTRTKKRTDYTVLADPGTWSYVNYFKLPDFLFKTKALITFYNNLGFDIAGSVDWPIVDRIKHEGKFMELSPNIKEYRRQLTIDLAQDFIDECNKRDDLTFIPFGTAQGYSKGTYRDSVRRLLQMGYKYIAVGGLPSSSEQYVLELLPIIWKEIQRAG
jgi:hypothetical protein